MLVRITTVGPLAGELIDLPAREAIAMLNEGTAERPDTAVPPIESAFMNPVRERAVIPPAVKKAYQ